MIRQKLLQFSFLLVLASTPLHVLAGSKATLAAPPSEGLTQVEFSTDEVSKWSDLPMGTYRVPGSDVIISGHQKGGATGMLFGVIGVAIQGSINAHNGKEAMASAEQALTFTIDDEAKAKLQAAMNESTFSSRYTGDASATRKLDVTGAVVLSFASATDVQPYVVLRAKLLGNNGKSKLWSTRYIASKGARRPLTGDGSWTADNGTALRAQISDLLDLSIRTMLKDVANPYPRDEASLITVQGYFPHVNKPLQVVGYKLAEEEGRTLFLPKLGNMIVFTGVNILDTTSVSQHATVKGESVLRLIKPEDLTLPAQASTTVEPVASESTNATETLPETDTEATEAEVQGEAENKVS